MTRPHRLVGIFAGAVLAFAGSAQAASIDFTGAFGAPLDGLSSFTSVIDPDGVQWTLDAEPVGAEFNYTAGWGLGIRGVVGGLDNHEAELPEYFTLTFNKPVDNVVIGLNRLNRRGPDYMPYFEGGFYRINDGAEVWFFGNDPSVQGAFDLILGDNIMKIVFSGLGLRMPGVWNTQSDREEHGFKLASLDYALDRTTVPEPASLVLLGLGLAGAGVILRRRQPRQ